MKKIHIKECRYCGGTEFVSGVQMGQGAIQGEGMLSGAYLNHTICLNCGSVLRSYVVNPERLLSRKERRQREAAKDL